MAFNEEPRLRIGELSRRVGIAPELLRAWERRYGVLEPARTSGGLRLYSEADEQRIRLMQRRMAGGLSAAEAARLARTEPDAIPAPAGDGPPLDGEAGMLREALDRLDADSAHAALDRMLASVRLETVLAEVVIPFLRELGERWSDGSASVAQEHFASNLLRSRLAALTRGWESGGGPLALLACAPGEQHDLPLMAFGLALRGRGWRVAYLGADTPTESLAETARDLDPALVVVSAVTPARFRNAKAALAKLAKRHPLAVAGAGASESLAESLAATFIPEDPVSAAERVTTERAAA